MNEKILQGILVAVIVLGSGFLMYSLVAPTSNIPAVEQVITPTDDIKKSNTSNLETYRNEEFGFEFKYPDSLINIKEDAVFKMKDHVTLFFPGCDVEFGEYTGRGFSPDIDMDRKTVRVGGIEVEQTTWYWDETFGRIIEGRDRTSSNRNISASVSASEKNPSSTEVCFALFDQILSTFRFIE